MEPPDLIRELLYREVPEKLWHYTSVEGFYGIVTSKTIFATDVRFLNDREEFIHARKIATQVLEETRKHTTVGFPSAEHMQTVIDHAFTSGQNRMQVFVASFSAVADQLSQWRGYSYGSSGASLGFRLGGVRPLAGVDTMVSFAPCVYRLEEKKALVRHALLHFINESRKLMNESHGLVEQFDGAGKADPSPALIKEIAENYVNSANFTERIGSAMAMTAVDLLRIAALLKDESFSEEAEWRLVLPVPADKQKLQNPIRFRAKSSTLIPYIAHPISADPAVSLPLVDLILGPGSHPNASQSATCLLQSEGIEVTPRESSVPYQPW